MRAVRKISVHFEYLENRLRGLDVTWQPVRRDLTAHPWTFTLPWDTILNVTVTGHKLSQWPLTADWLAPREIECSRTRSNVSSEWLPSYTKARWLVLEISKWMDTFRIALVHVTILWMFSSMAAKLCQTVNSIRKLQREAVKKGNFTTLLPGTSKTWA